MSNTTVTLTEENLERLQRIGHLHCTSDDGDTIVTLEVDEHGE